MDFIRVLSSVSASVVVGLFFVLSLLNDDSMTYEWKHEKVVFYIFFPIILAIGTLSNVLTILVVLRKKMRTDSAYFYMLVLAIADELVTPSRTCLT